MAKEGEKPEACKQAEEALGESEERYRALFKQSRDAVYITSRDGRIVDVNRSMLELFGYTREEFIGMLAQDTFVDPAHRLRYQREIEEKGAVGDYEVRLRKKDGTEMDCLVTSTVRRAKDGSILGYQGIIRDITERKRAEEALQRSLEETARAHRLLLALSHAAQAVQRARTPEEVYRTVAEEIARLGYHAVIFTLTDDRQHLAVSHLAFEPAVLRAAEKLAGLSAQDYRFPLVQGGFFQRIIAEGETSFTEPTAKHMAEALPEAVRPLAGRLTALLGMKQSILAPLTVGGETHGLLTVSGTGLTEADVPAITTFAHQAAIAIENARLHEKTRRKAGELAALYDVSLDVAAQLEIEQLLKTIIERATRLLNARGGGIYLYDPAKLEIELRASYGYFTKDYKGTKLALGEGLSGKVAQSGEPLVVEDYAHWEGRSLKYDGELSINVLGIPLKRGGELLGVLFINHEVEKSFDEGDIRLATLFANQAAIAIENARLYEQTDERLRHLVADLTALNAIAESLTGTLELDEILESVVTRVARVMQARICTIRLVEGNELTMGAAVGYKDESLRQHRIKIDPRLARIVRDQRPLLVEDLWRTGDIPSRRRMRALQERVHSFLGVPMISKGETIGVLSVYGEKPHRFREEEVRLLSTIANQAAIAIENARLYERIREHAEELERLVQERTKELQAIQAELLQSAKLAALGQLAAGVAHELNNPLGVISGYLELLQEEMELGPREMEYMERIEKRIQQATKIVGELKSLGMPSEPAWQTIDINDILEETLTLVERRLSLHQIKIQKEMAPNLPQIHADPDRLEQVFINLITNAKQAMGEGGTLRVACRESQNGEWVEIIFADTGEGIAKEHLDKIFDPFFTTRGPGKGMGLGLSVSHRHIKDHGGVIHVWSERGRGTVFRVALPPSRAKRCWEILDCHEKERCKAVRENVDYRCWSVMEDVSLCERCEVYRRKALPPLDGSLLPQ